MRIYVPATLPLLQQWRQAGGIPSDAISYAVTAAVTAAVDGDSEEHEYAVSVLAADESLLLLAGEPDAQRRRVVVAVDAAANEAEGALVQLSEDIAWSKVAALLVDDVRSTNLVVAAIEAADPELLDETQLLWFAPDELDALVAESL